MEAGARTEAPARAQATLALLLCALLLWSCADRPDDPPPNLVLIVVDTLRADRLGAYGSDAGLTPALDRLAGEASVFERSLSVSTWTLPSLASLLTGLLPDQHGVRSLEQRLAHDRETVAARLRRAGYATAAFTDGGFAGPDWGFASGFDHYSVTPGAAWDPKDVRVVVDSALHFLEDEQDQPFFLFVHTYETHQPYRNREGFADPLLPDSCRPRFSAVARVTREAPPDLGDRACVAALYDGGVRRADHHLGRLIEALRASAAWPRTAVIVTSDHGEELAEHGGWEHGLGKVFDENVAVPLILREPGAPAARVALPVTSLDVAPTLLALAGVSPGATLPGRSLRAEDRRSAGPRAVAVHGLNSYPDANEERWRVDLGEETLILDSVRDRLLAFDRTRDPSLRKPVPLSAGSPALAHLQALLAWRGEGAWAARLPAGTRQVVLPDAGDWRVLGHWRGTSWRSGSSETLDAPTAPLLLVLEGPDPAPPGLALRCELDDGTHETLRLVPAPTGTGWHPLDASPPAIGALWRVAGRDRAPSRRLSDREAERLEALGYLRGSSAGSARP